jgi:tetratricopeptide (TPR) repeat protein
MFKHLFATMNEVLDEVASQYPSAGQARRAKLDQQIHTLKKMSDEFIENWLAFEEKLRAFLTEVEPHAIGNTEKLHHQSTPIKAESSSPPSGGLDIAKQSIEFRRGQGYYMLRMYDRAIIEFEAVLKRHPECLLTRTYLAMGHVRTGDYSEASRHLQLLIPLTDNAKIKAISYNIMGCIHYEKRNVDKATEYFSKAYHSDPTVMSLDE